MKHFYIYKFISIKMKNMSEKMLFLTLVMVISSLIAACSNDSNDIESVLPELIIGNNTRDGGSNVSDDDYEDVSTWPSEEEMASQTYFPVGTRWEELWAAARMKQEDGNSITPVYKAPRRKEIPNRDFYEDEPYQYFTMSFEVDRDTIVDGLTFHHVSISSDFVEPTEHNTEWPLLDFDHADFYIQEIRGVVYYVGVYGLMWIGSDCHKDLVCDFVWTEGKELSRVDMCYYDDDDLIEVLGTVSQETVKMKKLCDGKYYLYMPSANLYRGIGRTTESLFFCDDGIVPTTCFEVVRYPVGLSRFYRDGTLIYENQEMLSKHDIDN